MESTIITIDGMHCQACVRRVSAAIQKVPGIVSAKVEVGSAAVEFDPQTTSPPAIAEAVKSAGFEVRK
jgi:copper chaperone